MGEHAAGATPCRHRRLATIETHQRWRRFSAGERAAANPCKPRRLESIETRQRRCRCHPQASVPPPIHADPIGSRRVRSTSAGAAATHRRHVPPAPIHAVPVGLCQPASMPSPIHADPKGFAAPVAQSARTAALVERAAPAASPATATPAAPEEAGSTTLAQLDAHEEHIQLAPRGSRSTLMRPASVAAGFELSIGDAASTVALLRSAQRRRSVPVRRLWILRARAAPLDPPDRRRRSVPARRLWIRPTVMKRFRRSRRQPLSPCSA